MLRAKRQAGVSSQCRLAHGEAWAPKGLKFCIAWLRELPAGRRVTCALYATTSCLKLWAWPSCGRFGNCLPTKTTFSAKSGTASPFLIRKTYTADHAARPDFNCTGHPMLSHRDSHACITSNRCALGLPPRPLDLCYQSGPQVFPGFEPGHDVTDPRMAQEVILSLSLATAVTLAALLFTALLPHI